MNWTPSGEYTDIRYETDDGIAKVTIDRPDVRNAFRPLTTYERELLEKLLEPEFPGRDELRQQLNSVTAKQLHEDGTLDLPGAA